MKLKTFKFHSLTICLSCFVFVQSLFAQDPVYKFERISVGLGLSQSSITSIIQDKDGFLWFGTIDGLNKYDGYNFTIYRHNTYDQNSLSENWISDLLIDNSGDLWICTRGGGINRYDKQKGYFHHYQYNNTEKNSIASDKINTAFQDRSGILWVGSDSGLTMFDFTSGKFSNYKNKNDNFLSHQSNYITAIFEDSRNILWIGTHNGLFTFDKSREKFIPINLHNENRAGNMISGIIEKDSGCLWISSYGGFYSYNTQSAKTIHYKNIPGNNNTLSNNSVQAIFPDKNDILWIATYGGGLERFNTITEKFTHLTYDPTNQYTLSNNNIKSLFIDKSGILWVGNEAGGLNKYFSGKEKFKHFKNNPSNSNSLNNNLIFALLLDQSDNLWIGTWGGGINKFNRAKNEYKFYKFNLPDFRNFGLNTIKSLLEDKSGNIFAGTFGEGLLKYDKKSDKFISVPIPRTKTDEGRQGNFISVLYEDSYGDIWLGTEGDGLYRYNDKSNRFRYIHFLQKGIRTMAVNSISSILQSSDGYLWIGTSGGGLIKFDRNTEEYIIIENDKNNPESLCNNNIKTLHESADGILWIGTRDGLCRYDKNKNSFTAFTTSDGLANNFIYGILSDSKENLWISTNRGISKLNPFNKSIINFTPGDGLQDYEFNTGSYYKSKSGEMFFGGLNGFNSFSPENIEINYNKPIIKLISFKIFGRPAEFDRPVSEMKVIELPYYSNLITFEFVALDYLNPTNNQYAYKLEGFDNEWIFSGTRRVANYTNLDPGEYNLKIKGSNGDGVWNEEGISIIIRIIPPFWQTIWFKILLPSFILLSILALYLIEHKKAKKQQNILEKLVQDRTWELNQRNEELQIINNIILSIGSEIDFVQILNKALDQLKLINGVERSAALIRQGESDIFKFMIHSGFSDSEIENISINFSDVEDHYLKYAKEISKDIFIINSYDNLTHLKGFNYIKIAKSSFILRIAVDKRIEGYLIFDNMQNDNVFNDVDTVLLNDIKENFISAFVNAIKLEELKALNKDKDFFLGSAAHNLMNPLGVIINYASDLYENMNDSNFDVKASRNELSEILNISDRMKNLLSELMQINSMESGKISFDFYEVNLKLAIDPSIEFYQTAATIKGIELINNINYPLPRVLIDNRKIMEVMDNLLSNAIKYTYPNGTVTISSEIIKNQVFISVQDTGQGLNEYEMKDLFKSFKKLSAKPTGGEPSTGLGLTIVRKVIENHGGKIFVESRKGTGSTFKFSLPIKK